LAQCAAGAGHARCFTTPQSGALEKIYGVVRDANGKLPHPSWLVGAEVVGPDGKSGSDNWIIRASAKKTIAYGFAEGFF